MIVEFIGMAGSGKTSLAQMVAPSLGAVAHDMGEPPRRDLGAAADACPSHIRALLGYADEGDRKRLVKAGWREQRWPDPSETLLLEEGPRQTLAAALTSLPAPRLRTWRAIRNQPRPDTFVHVTVDHQVALRRLRERPKTYRPTRLPEPDALAWMDAFVGQVDRILKVCRRPVVRIDTSAAELDVSARELTDSLRAAR